MGRLGVAMLLVGCLSSVSAWAGSEPMAGQGSDRVDELMVRHNLHPAFEKLGRGVSNVLFGWAEIPLNIHKRYTESDTGGSYISGAVHGVVKGVVRTGVGVYETATFFLPYPEDFRPVLPILEYFKRSPKRERLPLE